MAKEVSNSAKPINQGISNSKLFFSEKEAPFFKHAESENAFLKSSILIPPPISPVQKKQENGGNLADEIQLEM